jgi:hypothetical protein
MAKLRLVLWPILLVVAVYYVVLHFRAVQIAHPITQDEPGFVELTAGGNPYTLEGVAAAANVYGPAYAWWARPFTQLIADPYVAHRVANTAALGVILALLAWTLTRSGVGGVETACGVGVVYMLVVSSHSLAASADLLAMLCYVAALVASERGTWPGLIAGLGLSILGGLAKPYAALGAIIVASHLLLFAPRRKAFVYLAAAGLGAVATAAALGVLAPYYFFSTLGVQRGATTRSGLVLYQQTRDFAVLAGAFVVLAVWRRPRRRRLAVRGPGPLLTPAVDLWDWAALVAAAVLLGQLGWHAGNFLVYYYHLLLVPLVVAGLRQLPRHPRTGWALLGANLLVLGFLLPPMPGDDHWTALEINVAGVHGRILADPLLEPLTRTQPNLELFERGQTASILHALDKSDATTRAAQAELYARLDGQAGAKAARIAAGEFDAIYLAYQDVGTRRIWSYDRGRFLPPLLANYEPTGEILFYPYCAPFWERTQHGEYPYHVTKWVPKRPAPAPARTAQ